MSCNRRISSTYNFKIAEEFCDARASIHWMEGNQDYDTKKEMLAMCSSTNNLSEVKAVIFDYGEVLCHPPTPDQTARLASFFGVGVDRLPALWERNRGAYDRGDLTAESYWSTLAADAGTAIGPGQIEQICNLDVAMWSNINPRVVEWARELASNGMKLGLLSNMHPDMVTHCRKQFAWIEDFDFVTFSAEVRLIKPDPAIYEHTLRGLGVAPAEALFLDDREINIRAARALGINTIHVRSIAQLRKDLQAAGFSLLPAVS